jgi:hypothetical protein
MRRRRGREIKKKELAKIALQRDKTYPVHSVVVV